MIYGGLDLGGFGPPVSNRGVMT